MSANAATAKPQILAERFKTKMCKNFEEQGSCPYETRCMFAHGDHEMRTKQMNLNDNLVTEEAIKAFQKSKALADKASPKKKSAKSNTPTASSKAAAKTPAAPVVKPAPCSSVSASKTAALRSFVEVCAAGATAKDEEASGSLASLSASANTPLADAHQSTDDAPPATTTAAMPPATMSVGSLSDDCSSSYRDPTPGASPSRPATPQAPANAIAGQGNQRRHDSAATTPSKRWRHDPYAAAAAILAGATWCDSDDWMEQEDAMMQHAYYHPSSFGFDHPQVSETEFHGVADNQQFFAPTADGLSTYGRQRRAGNGRRAILGVA